MVVKLRSLPAPRSGRRACVDRTAQIVSATNAELVAVPPPAIGPTPTEPGPEKRTALSYAKVVPLRPTEGGNHGSSRMRVGKNWA